MMNVLNSAKIIVCVGSGGVGKTTTAAALGALGARIGKNVLVLTIDPSKRLKTTLGLSDNGEISQISHSEFKGTLSAAVIDAKKTFDDFVRKASSAGASSSAEAEARAQKMLNNKLYIQLSTTLSGSQEFTALEKLYSNFESKKYDLIILDTPPTKHAIDFLMAPQKLSNLFHEGIAKWFRESRTKHSMIANILHAGTMQMLKILESLTGSEFMHELAEFFRSIETWQDKLEERVTAVHRLLVSPATQFILVTSFDEAKLKEAEYFLKEIKKGGYKIAGVIINRAFPAWMKLQNAESLLTTTNENPALMKIYLKMRKYYLDKIENYKAFTLSAERKMNPGGKVFSVPEFKKDLSCLDDIVAMSETLRVNV